jgi:hypothetical protein
VTILRTSLIIVLATTLVGCSRQPLHQAAAESCTDELGGACFNRTAAGLPLELKSFKTNPPTKETKLIIAAKTGKRPHLRARVRSHLATKNAKPAIIAAKAEPPATRIPLPPHSSRAQLDSKSSATADSNTARANIADPQPILGRAPNSNGRSIQEQVGAATVVAERMTVAERMASASTAAARDGAEPSAGASYNDPNPLVAVVIVRPDIRSVSDLAGKNVAIDDRYLVSSADVRMAIAAAGGPVVQLSAGKTAAIDRLLNGEVPAAVLALVSTVAAEGFPEIAGFRIFHIPLSPGSLTARP